MKFKTTDLIARIDVILAERLAESEAQQLKAELAERDSGSNWLSANTKGFRELAHQIHWRLDNNMTITFDDVPESIQDRYHSLKFYAKPSARTAEDRTSENLKKLRNALRASQEDTVSPTAIKQLGFQDVTFLFTQEAAK